MALSKDSIIPLISLLWLIRDARSTKGAERQLLDALAMRCNPKQGYSCFPSYALLAKGTGLSIISLKRAAAALEKAGKIRRRTRQNKSNIFFLNIALLQEEAAAQKAADQAEREQLHADSGHEPGSPFEEPAGLTKEDNGQHDPFADRSTL